MRDDDFWQECIDGTENVKELLDVNIEFDCLLF